MAKRQDPRIQELLDLAEAEGITLPYDPEFIAQQEDLGNIVDLTTGAIILNGATAHLGGVGDRLTIMSYTEVEEAQARHWQPRIIVLGEKNIITAERGL